MASADNKSTSKGKGEMVSAEDKVLIKAIKSLLRSCRRDTEVLRTSFVPPAAGTICVGNKSNRSCCAWNENKVMCCLIKRGKEAQCHTWPRDEDCVCYTKDGKVYCVE